MEENEQISLLKADYESKISNLKNVLSKAKLAYDQQKTLFNEKVHQTPNFSKIFFFSAMSWKTRKSKFLTWKT